MRIDEIGDGGSSSQNLPKIVYPKQLRKRVAGWAYTGKMTAGFEKSVLYASVVGEFSDDLALYV
jgi:hypothetical protein